MDNDLTITNVVTSDERFEVSYAELNGSVREMNILKSFYDLVLPSPAVKAYLSWSVGKPFNEYSRTDMNVVSLPTEGKIALVKNHIISDLFGSVDNIVESHKLGKHYIIEEAKDPNTMNFLLEVIQFYEHKNLAMILDPTSIVYATNNPDTTFSKFMFDDKILGLKSEDFHNYAKNQSMGSNIIFYNMLKSEIERTKLPFLNLVRLSDTGGSFDDHNISDVMPDKEVALRIEPKNKADESFPYSLTTLYKENK